MAQVINGTATPSGLLLDDVYIAVKAPTAAIAAGGSAFNGGCVGGASWGPKNTPIACSGPGDLLAKFGPPINSGFDLVQEGALFLKQLPQGSLYAVRVTDGTDVAATGDLTDTAAANALVLTAKYTGSAGNTIRAVLSPGSNSTVTTPTWKLTIQLGAQAPETFDRIAQGTAGAIWTNLMNAINNTTTGSQLVTAALPGTPSTANPAAAGTSVTLASGTDGATAITTSNLVGTDGAQGARTGMYALRGVSVDAVWLCGCSDSASWSTVAQFAQSVKAVGYGALPKSTTVSAAVTAKQGAGLDTPYFVLLKDWVYYLDTFFNLNVEVPPSCVAAGIACRLSPEQSPGNKPAYGLVGTENTLVANPQPYATADLGQLEAVGINIITNPIPAGATFGLRHGKNTSSTFATSEIPYARKTNDLIRSMSNSLGQFVNLLQSTDTNDPLRRDVTGALNGLLGPQKASRLINDFKVTCDLTNNPPAQIKQGLLVADVVVSYMAVVDKFIVNLTAGQTVDVVSTAQQAAA